MWKKLVLVVIVCLLVSVAGCSIRQQASSPMRQSAPTTTIPQNQQDTSVPIATNPATTSTKHPSPPVAEKQEPGAIPAAVQSTKARAAVVGAWTKGSCGSDQEQNIWDIPLEPAIRMNTTGVTYSQGEPAFSPGKPIRLDIYLENTSDNGGLNPAQAITVLEYDPAVEILCDAKSGGAVTIWKQTTSPVFLGTLEHPGDFYRLEITWYQSDLKGNQVPPGHYGAELMSGTLRYRTPDGNVHTQQLAPAVALMHVDIVVKGS